MKNKGTFVKYISLLLPSVLFSVVTPIITINVFGKDAANTQSQIETSSIKYEEFKYDYIVRQPNAEQIEQFKNSQYSTEVIEYSLVMFEFTMKNEPVEQNILYTNNKCEFTEFCDARIATKTNDVQNSIYIDYIFAHKYNLSLNSKLTSGNFEFVVTRIYKNYDLSFAYAPSLKQMYEAQSRPAPKTTGVYVVTNNKQAFFNENLKEYKPLNEIREKTSDQSDEEYQQYLNEFYAKDYSSRITDKSEGQASSLADNKALKSSINTKVLLETIISSIVLVLVCAGILFIPFKKVKNEVDTHGVRKNVQIRYLVANASSIIAFLVSFLVVCAVVRLSCLYYVSYSLMITQNILCLIIPVVCVLFMELISYFVIRGFNEKKIKDETR